MNRQHRYMDPPTKGEENDPSDNHLEGRSTCGLQGGTLGPVASVVASEGGVTTRVIEWNVPVWEHSLEGGLRMLSLAIDTHIITSRLRVGHF